MGPDTMRGLLKAGRRRAAYKEEKVLVGLCVPAAKCLLNYPPWAEGEGTTFGLSYVEGFEEMVAALKDCGHRRAEAYLPVGLSFRPFYRFEHGSMTGGELGPIVLIYGEGEGPIDLSYGIGFIPGSEMSRYAGAGLSYYIARGEDFDRSTPGLFLAGGMEFMRSRRASMSLEIARDRSRITFKPVEHRKNGREEKDAEVTPLTVSIRVVV